MKWYWKVLIALIVLILVIFGGLIYLMKSSAKPSTGEKIMTYSYPKKALMIIDMQEAIVGENSPMKDRYPFRKRVIGLINQIQKDAQQEGMPIIYIRQEYSDPVGKFFSKAFMHGLALPGSESAKLDARIPMLSQNDFTKNKGDAFYNPKLNEFLINNSIGELFITGVDGEFCVHSTIKGALQRGYKVHVIKNAILLGNADKWDSLMKEFEKEGVKLRNSEKSIY